MDRCDYIEPLLGAYQDGELPTVQAAAVQEHLRECSTCSDALLDFAVLGHRLREVIIPPSLDGFAETVMSCLPEPGHAPGAMHHLLDGLRQRWIPALTLVSTATAAAALMIVFLGRVPSHAGRVESFAQLPAPVAPVAQPSQVAAADEDDGLNASETFISRLETKDPSVAVWSEPDNKTTVIWLPDENSGNY